MASRISKMISNHAKRARLTVGRHLHLRDRHERLGLNRLSRQQRRGSGRRRNETESMTNLSSCTYTRTQQRQPMDTEPGAPFGTKSPVIFHRTDLFQLYIRVIFAENASGFFLDGGRSGRQWLPSTGASTARDTDNSCHPLTM